MEFGIIGDILLDALPCSSLVLVLTDLVWSCGCVLLNVNLGGQDHRWLVIRLAGH